ncbi:hypothetical protein K431DRAFT_287199 [Polychaeton citri CBS 116435]|uniref:Uncharacterized protein n=1 Tax=Polychaeton citri CBS 116435 TaxID=1314669 RepID=A0A9P4Q327_9PEZI|nr:hypothetical protein K431DRAFT_287199 [Polychaeton citri CBS 116435]
MLKEKHRTIMKLHRERLEQVKKLVEALESYASHLEPAFLKVKLPPTAPDAKVPPTFDLSPTYVGHLDLEFTRVYEEYNKRIVIVAETANEIIGLWSDLGTPQAQIDSHIVQSAHEAPEQLGLHQEDLKRLTAKRDKLLNEMQQRERKIKELKIAVEGLWDRLGVEANERKQFLAANRGCGLRTINEFEDELSRLNELKRQNLHLFVEDARFHLQELWDAMYFSEEEMLEFTPAFSDVYTDALLEAHEREIARLDALKEQRAPILAAIDKHQSLLQDREDLEKSSQDASRLMSKGAKGEKRDPGKLLREEKQRRRITKELPKVEADLRKRLEQWEDEYGRPFCVRGERYLDEIEVASAKAPPPRSKTPNASSGRDDARSAPASEVRGRANTSGVPRNTPVNGHNRTKSAHAASTIAAPPRSKTPSTLSSRNAPPMSASTTVSRASPSKIPTAGRLPMSPVKGGNSSPERRPAMASSRSKSALSGHHPQKLNADFNSSTMGRSVMGPSRAPPPKMKDLFAPQPPTPTSGPYASNAPNSADMERSASVIRHRSPEDPYFDGGRYQSLSQHPTLNLNNSLMGPPPRPNYSRATPSQESHFTSSSYNSSNNSSQWSGSISRHNNSNSIEYPTAPPSRAASQASSLYSQPQSQTSGSENWETYTDNSDDAEETDATEAYYAKVQAQKLRAAQTQWEGGFQGGNTIRPGSKRPTPPPIRTGSQKKQAMLDTAAEGSEAGWTDEAGSVGECY